MPGVAPVSNGQNQTNSAVPASGNPSQPDTDAQGNNTDTPTRGQYSSQQGDESLSEEEKRQVQELQARDRQVRAHEAAHAAAGGRYVSRGPSYSYQRGPDGRQYAVGGEVQIDTSPVAGDPQATLQKAEAIQAAASAPANPSPQDRRVALSAARMAARARLEIMQEKRAEQEMPEGYEPPGIRAYNNLAGYFERQSAQSTPISVQA
ncbi:MAG: hypothetical protein HUJ29_07015 [Gammaproteobacteria bacterium]|nr:hypothetical protein [Gammaproteobacteria bacterium]